MKKDTIGKPQSTIVWPPAFVHRIPDRRSSTVPVPVPVLATSQMAPPSTRRGNSSPWPGSTCFRAHYLLMT